MHRHIKLLRDRCDEEGECWLWKQSLTHGYGRVELAGMEGMYAHTVAWIAVRGPVPAGKRLVNLCGQKNCCRPLHWSPMTIREQNLHYVKLGAWRGPDRSRKIALAMRAKRSPLTPEIVSEIRAGSEAAHAMAAKFGVSKATIYKIRAGTSWRDAAPNSSVFAPRR